MKDIKERLTHRALQMELGDFCTDLLIAAGMIDELEEHNKELLEALENLLKVHEGEGGTQHNAADIARAAIATAKGEE